MTAAEDAPDLLAAIRRCDSFSGVAEQLRAAAAPRPTTASSASGAAAGSVELEALGGLIITRLDQLSGMELSNILWAYATLGGRADVSVVGRVASALKQHLLTNNLAGRDLINAFWALTALGLAQHEACTCIRRRLAQELPYASSRQLAAVAWACAVALQSPQSDLAANLDPRHQLLQPAAASQAPPPPPAPASTKAGQLPLVGHRLLHSLLADVAAAAAPQLDDAPTAELVQLLISFGAARHLDAPLVAAAAGALAPRVAATRPADIASAVAACATLQQHEYALLHGAAQHLSPLLSSSRLADQLRRTQVQAALAAAAATPPPAPRGGGGVAGAAAGAWHLLRQASLSAANLANRSGVHLFQPAASTPAATADAGGTAVGQHGVGLPLLVNPMLASEPPSKEELAHIDADVVATLAHSYSLLHHYHAPLFTALFQAVAQLAVSSLRPAHLEQLMQAQLKAHELRPDAGRLMPSEVEMLPCWFRINKQGTQLRLPDYLRPSAFAAFQVAAIRRNQTHQRSPGQPQTGTGSLRAAPPRPPAPVPPAAGAPATAAAAAAAASRPAPPTEHEVLQAGVERALDELGVIPARTGVTIDGAFSVPLSVRGEVALLALELLSPSHCLSNPPYLPDGATVARHRSLQFRGWRVLPLHWAEWAALPGPDERRDFLCAGLERFLGHPR